MSSYLQVSLPDDLMQSVRDAAAKEQLTPAQYARKLLRSSVAPQEDSIPARMDRLITAGWIKDGAAYSASGIASLMRQQNGDSVFGTTSQLIQIGRYLRDSPDWSPRARYRNQSHWEYAPRPAASWRDLMEELTATIEDGDYHVHDIIARLRANHTPTAQDTLEITAIAIDLGWTVKGSTLTPPVD